MFLCLCGGKHYTAGRDSKGAAVTVKMASFCLAHHIT